MDYKDSIIIGPKKEDEIIKEITEIEKFQGNLNKELLVVHEVINTEPLCINQPSCLW